MASTTSVKIAAVKVAVLLAGFCALFYWMSGFIDTGMDKAEEEALLQERAAEYREEVLGDVPGAKTLKAAGERVKGFFARSGDANATTDIGVVRGRETGPMQDNTIYVHE
jgi:hypothetical protein